MEKKNNRSKQVILTIIALIGIIVITMGVTYAFFNYVKEGTTENSVTTGTITFLYTEVSGVGNGISISDAYPVSDEVGKAQTGEGNVFDFKVTSTTMNNVSIPYEVTARMSSDSTLDPSAVKIYLTEVSGDIETEVLLDNYSNLTQTEKVDVTTYIEKVIYQGEVEANSSSYEKDFRLRMWIDEDTDFSDESMNGKTFMITVNVYANASVVMEEGIISEFLFDYNGAEQEFSVPITGFYKLEVWGAQGGTANSSYLGGYGGYSAGTVSLKQGDIIYIYVGGKGSNGVNTTKPGGYNGGGIGQSAYSGAYFASGGGATHISTTNRGVLSNYQSYQSELLIVAGGGGGSWYQTLGYTILQHGGSGGGYKGGSANGTIATSTHTIATGGTQTEGGKLGNFNASVNTISGSFGQGGNHSTTCGSGGGGGFYGGGGSSCTAGGGGSGYIGNLLLTNKVMYCYNCEESTDESIKTISTTNVSEEPISNYAKIGNGYARITYLGK